MLAGLLCCLPASNQRAQIVVGGISLGGSSTGTATASYRGEAASSDRLVFEVWSFSGAWWLELGGYLTLLTRLFPSDANDACAHPQESR